MKIKTRVFEFVKHIACMLFSLVRNFSLAYKTLFEKTGDGLNLIDAFLNDCV